MLIILHHQTTKDELEEMRNDIPDKIHLLALISDSGDVKGEIGQVVEDID